MDSPLDVLLIDSDADDERIEEAYRDRIKEAHPDHGGTVEEFRAVRDAYERLVAGEWDREDLNGQQSVHGRDSIDRPYPLVRATVSYLNYDVISDFGWEMDDDDLFEKAREMDLNPQDFGRFETELDESVLEAAERCGYPWPFACRGGACANCAIMLRKGELSMPPSTVLPAELMEQGIRLSCNGMPVTEELEVIYNVKHIPELEDLLLPPRPFVQTHHDD